MRFGYKASRPLSQASPLGEGLIPLFHEIVPEGREGSVRYCRIRNIINNHFHIQYNDDRLHISY